MSLADTNTIKTFLGKKKTPVKLGAKYLAPRLGPRFAGTLTWGLPTRGFTAGFYCAKVSRSICC